MVRKAVRSLAALALFGAVAAPTQARAFDLGVGVNGGVILIGTRPRFAVSPHVDIAWRTDAGFLLALRDVLSILPATDIHGAGAYNHASVAIGYAWKTGTFSLGPSLAVYSVAACGPQWCDRLSGLAPGATAHLAYYLPGPFGVSASATLDWLTGSAVLPAGVAATVLVGPLLRWNE